MATTKLPTRTKTQQLLPSAAVQAAYDVQMLPEAAARLPEIKEYADYLAQEADAASRLTVTDDATDALASERLVNLTKARKGLEDLHKFFSKPLKDRAKLVDGLFKKLIEVGVGQEDRLRTEHGNYFVKKENERRDAEAKRLRDQEAATRKAAQLGRSAPKPVAAPAVPEVAKTVQTENGSANVSLYWGYDVVDAARVPQKYWVLDTKAIQKDIDDGAREIAGLVITQKPRVAVR